uniref:XRN2-binding (XTBD) domain-containing protein n=1 Tax=viral metagenome TaxID=1070528 RepID=A0A6C0IYF3_9ZZZZ
MEISYNGISLFLKKNQFESDDTFNRRAWFIIKQEPKNLKELNKIIDYSLFWINIEYYNCKYNDSITDKILELKKNIYK